MTELVDVATAIVVPAMRAVFEEGEVTRFALTYSGEMSGSIVLSLAAVGETYRDYIVQGDVRPASDEELRERLRSNLVDFVAESRFGSGQNRDRR